jgi:hypothetical protein
MAVSLLALMYPPHSTPQNFFSAFATHFCQRLSKLQCVVRLEELCKLKKLAHLIWSRNRDLSA